MIAAETKRLASDFYIEGRATTFNDPYLLWEWDGVKYYEQIDAHALDGADLSDVIMQYNHDGRVLARKSNKTLIVEPTARDLFVAADLSKSSAAKELYEEIQNGLVTRMSWAFRVQEDSYDRDTHTRTILKIKKVYDVSAVSFPANPSTEISARSWVDGVIEASKREALERRRKILLLKIRLEEMK
jgi:HK97 family phage prohead protease